MARKKNIAKEIEEETEVKDIVQEEEQVETVNEETVVAY